MVGILVWVVLFFVADTGFSASMGQVPTMKAKQDIATDQSDDRLLVAKNSRRQKKGRTTESGKRIVERDNNIVYADSSEAHRENVKYSAVVELIGFTPFPTMGLAGGYYQRPDLLIELSHVQGKSDVLFFELESSLTSIRAKKWWGNSFYGNFGVGARRLKAGYTLSALTGNDDLSASAEATSLGIDFTIGNRWQWETFSIGCDWVGVFIPLAKLSASSTKGSGYDPEDYKNKEDDLDDLAMEHNTQFLRFYLGVSF